MAAYPAATDVPRKTKIEPVNQRLVIDRSDAGGIRLVDTGAADIYAITVEHPLADSTQRATFWAFFNANRLAQNSIAPAGSGDTYNVFFDGVPSEEQVTATRWNINVKLIGNKV